MKDFNADFHRTRFFANKLNGIDLKKIEEKEREKLFIKNEVYLNRKPIAKKKQLNSLTKKSKYFSRKNDINPNLLKEIISDFHNQYNDFDVFYFQKKLEIKINLALNENHKTEIIEKEYKKILKKLNKIDSYYWSKMKNRDLEELLYENFNEYMRERIDDDCIIEYLTKEFNSYYNYKIFNEFISIKENEAKLDFCRKKLLNKEPNLKNIEKSKYPDVFPNKEKELFFYNFLKTYSCVKNNKPVDGNFQTYCDAYYETIKYLQRKRKSNLLIAGRIKNKFIRMINSEFNQDIKKLSSGTNYMDIAENFIENIIENKKELKRTTLE